MTTYPNYTPSFDPGWFCTDPDTLQFCKKINDTTYEFLQVSWNYLDRIKEFTDIDHWWPYPGDYGVTSYVDYKVINLEDYTNEAIADEIACFGYNLNSIKEIYPIEWEQIIAECIFENYNV